MNSRGKWRQPRRLTSAGISSAIIGLVYLTGAHESAAVWGPWVVPALVALGVLLAYLIWRRSL